MAITLSHGGPTIYRSPAPSKQVLVGTIQGVVCIERDADGPGWHVRSRALTDKHIHALLSEPTGNMRSAAIPTSWCSIQDSRSSCSWRRLRGVRLVVSGALRGLPHLEE